MPSNVLEYKFTIQIPSVINDISDSSICEEVGFDWHNDQCIEEWIISMENLDENLTCIENVFRTIEVTGVEDPLHVPAVCYSSCNACSDE